MKRTSLVAALACVAAACASAPPAPPKIPAPPSATNDQKMSWILRLEDQRVLHDPAPIVPPTLPAPLRGEKIPIVIPPPPPPDLVRLLTDSEPRIRRRAALAIGRVGLREGVKPLTGLLQDADPEVRQMAAFALGLIGDRSAAPTLIAALADESPLVKGSAAEALGLIGDASAADAVGKMAQQIVDSGALAEIPSEADDARRDTPAAALRLALYSLVRLKAYPQIALAVLDGAQPRVRWWPVAFALQRIEDPRAFQALLTLAKDPNPYTRGFAAKGLGGLKNRDAVPTLVPLVASSDRNVAVEAIRALGRIGDAAAVPALLKVVQTPRGDPHLRLEAVTALGLCTGEGTTDALLDTLSDPSPSIRAAAISALADRDHEMFVTVLSGLDPDAHWSVRAALATALGKLPAEIALPRLRAMLADNDNRVIPSVLGSLTALHATEATAALFDNLKHEDPVIRAAAARGMGELKPPNGPAVLVEAYRAAQRDVTYVARAAVLDALTKYGAKDATPTLTTALGDKDWAVRVRAAQLLKQLDPGSDADLKIRPAPTMYTPDFYEAPRMVNPPVSTQVYLELDRGLVQIELAVIDAPLTVETFITLARKKFFDGLTFHRVVPDFVVQGGDPRSDGEGGPGFTIRDELSERPYLRGTVGIALDWPDTGGSQFFITHSPQPHLDGRYTVIGRVVSGMEMIDQLQPWDVIRRVIVWDGQQ